MGTCVPNLGAIRRPVRKFCLSNLYVDVFICGGHHDSDRIAVLVMFSKAESIVLYLSSCSIMYTCQN